jgi:3-deoxy-D-manno-octulosonic-acid transferase
MFRVWGNEIHPTLRCGSIRKMSNIFLFIYHFVWTLILIPAVPFITLTGNKRLAGRFAVSVPPPMEMGGNIWIHALSVGEVMSAVSLVKAIKRAFPSKDIVFTVTTRSGMEIARKELKGVVSRLHMMPLDAWWSMRRFTKRIKPGVFVLVETDVWPGLLSHLKGVGVSSVLVNGRISPRTYGSYRRVPWLIRRMYEPLDLCFMQSDLDTDRLLSIGLDQKKVKTAGNIKFDREILPLIPGEKARWLELLGLTPSDPVWVAGSTHQGEEADILNAYKEIKKPFPLLRLILAPRDVSRAGELMRLIHSVGLIGARRSEMTGKRIHYHVLVLDTYGELDRVYGLGWICFVGGSLVPIGGHNLLEPAGLGIPVIFGPYTHNFVFISSSILKEGGGALVSDVDSLRDTVKNLLADKGRRMEMGRAAMRFVEKNRGAIRCVVSWCKTRLGEGAVQ